MVVLHKPYLELRVGFFVVEIQVFVVFPDKFGEVFIVFAVPAAHYQNAVR